MMFSLHYPDLMFVYCDVSYKLLLPGGLTSLLEVSAYTCDAQTKERWRVGGWEVFCFGNILIKVGSFYHRLISIGEKGEGQELRGEWGGERACRPRQPEASKRGPLEVFHLWVVEIAYAAPLLPLFSPVFIYLFFSFHKMFLFISVPMAPSITGFSCPWRAAQWSSEPRLRTQEGHHLVTRHLLQIPLQGDLASTVAVFGISTVNTCWRCLSPAYTWLHKKTLYLERGHVLQCCD